MLEYNDATNSGQCEPIRTSHGVRLYCKSTTVGQGYATTPVSLRSIENRSLKTERVTRLHDYTGGCKFEGEFKRSIEDRTVEDIDGDGSTEIVLRIRSVSGEPLVDDIPFDERCDRDNYEMTESETVEAWKIGPGGLTEIENPEALKKRGP